MRSFGTLLVLVATALLGAATVGDARILGAGVKASDCFFYLDNIDATKGLFTVECKDNSPCDGDTIAGQCTFRPTACTGATGVTKCTPADVTSFKGKAHGLVLPATGPANCAEPSDIVVKLKGRKPANKLTLKLTANTATGKPKRDLDTFVFKCIASPSGAFIFE